MASTPNRTIKFDHARDPAWLRKIHKDIFGGDPAPNLKPEALQRMAEDIIKASATFLDTARKRAVTNAVG